VARATSASTSSGERGPDDDGVNRVVAQRELQGRLRQRRAVALADVGESAGPGDQVLRRGGVVAGRRGLRSGASEQAGVEDASGKDGRPARRAQGKQVVERGLL
jgi:hypothetical protein